MIAVFIADRSGSEYVSQRFKDPDEALRFRDSRRSELHHPRHAYVRAIDEDRVDLGDTGEVEWCDECEERAAVEEGLCEPCREQAEGEPRGWMDTPEDAAIARGDFGEAGRLRRKVNDR